MLLVPISPFLRLSVSSATQYQPAAASLQQAQAMLLLRAVHAHTLQECWNGLGSFLQTVHTCNIDPHTWSNTESTCALAFFFPSFKRHQLAEMTLSFHKWHMKQLWVQGSYKVPILSRFLYLWKIGRQFRKKMATSYQVHYGTLSKWGCL